MLTIRMESSSRGQAVGQRPSDAPVGLRRLADVDKGAAVGRGLEQLTGRRFSAEIESLNYGAWDRQREFLKPAELRLWVRSIDRDGCGLLQAFADHEVEEAVAAELGAASGEGCRARIVDKRYVGVSPGGEMRLTMLIGRV